MNKNLKLSCVIPLYSVFSDTDTNRHVQTGKLPLGDGCGCILHKALEQLMCQFYSLTRCTVLSVSWGRFIISINYQMKILA